MKKKFQFSKMLPIMTTIIFVATLIYGLGSQIDSTAVITAITITGSIELTTIVAYMKNSWIEKTSRIKIDVSETIIKDRLKYNKEMLMFLKENGLTQEDLAMVEDESLADDFEASAIDSTMSTVDGAVEEASSEPEIQEV